MVHQYYILKIKCLVINKFKVHQYYITEIIPTFTIEYFFEMRNLIFILFFPLTLLSQNTIGLPDVINYKKQSYNGGLQNWDIKQDKNGIVYFANNEGLLSFDGTYWNLYPLPNKTIVRSVEISSDNKIYVGGQDEIGYFLPGKNGRLTYNSLTKLIPENESSFGDVWDIISVNGSIFFRTTYQIFKLTNQAIAVYTAIKEWSFMGLANDKLLAHDFSSGLLIFQDNVWKPAVQKNILPDNEPVTGILAIQKDSILITTLKSGVYLFSANAITKLNLANNALFSNDRIYAATLVNKKWIALATNNNGVYIIDMNGNIIQSFSKNEGLQNNNVLSIFLDKHSNLWLGLDNGIDFIAYNSAIKHISPNYQNGSGYTSVIYNNILYTGTSNGLYSVPLQQEPDLSFSKGNFNLIPNTNGQTWSLAVINDHLLLGHHEGAFLVKNNIAQPISNEKGYWNFIPLSGIFPAAQIIAGNYIGLTYFNYQNGTFSITDKVPGFDESSRFVTIDDVGSIWVSHPYHGVFKIIKSPTGNYQITTYNDKKGLPSTLNNHIYKIKNEVVAATEKGIFILNNNTNTFGPSSYYKKIFGEQSLRYLKEDASGNVWFVHEKDLGVVDFSEKEPAIIYIPELKDKILSGFEFIYPVNNENIFLGSENGFFHINYKKYKEQKPELNVQVRTVLISGTKDSLLYGGYFSDINEKQEQLDEQKPSISHRWKTIRFGFSSPLYGYQSNLEYSFKLEGYDDNWSDWSKRTEKEYTNLKAGGYIFKVKVRNNLGNESPIASYSFTIQPPWHQTNLAMSFYILIFVFIIYFLFRWQKKKFKRQQREHEEEQQRLLYIHDLEKNKSESELMNLKNEKLESEINFKNSELASTAMHLVKKAELLSKIKGNLSHVIKTVENIQAKEEVKKIIRSLNDDESIDTEWDNFSKHFDKVHSDFIKQLKQIHPKITPNELKLCAYLRMNLSTKEIAQLMNISVRGVEISRYRLRKKLEITSDVNLFDYLVKFQTSE